MKLSSREIRVLGIYLDKQDGNTCKKLTDVSRNSDREFDLSILGNTHDADNYVCSFSGWLPLAAIGWLVQWDRPEVVAMCDFGNLDAGWSAIRDSECDTIWKIFDRFVLEPNGLKK